MLPLASQVAQRLLRQVRPGIEPAQSFEKNQLGLRQMFFNSLRLTWPMSLWADSAVLLRTMAWLDLPTESSQANGEVEIYTQDELKSLLATARTEMVTYLVIAAFAGLRQAGLSRLNWSQVKDDHIFVLGGNTKTGRHRQVPILPSLDAWLRLHRQESGLVVPFKNVTNQLCKLVRQCGI